MITTLHIKNIGIIDDLSIDFNEGFNVLTGETGAGKSLVIDSLIILCGGRFSKEMIRKGQDYSFIEACIYDPNSKYSEDGNIIVSREIHTNGKNLCKVNNRLVTVSVLKNIMLSLVDVHAQNDSHAIMFQASHINYLDNYAKDKICDLKSKYCKLFCRYNEIKEELDRNFGNDKEKQRTLDLLTYQLNEINNADLKCGEEEQLESELKLVQNQEKICVNLTKSTSILNDTVIQGVENVLSYLSKIEDFDDKYKEKLNMLQSIYYDLQDISSTLSDSLYSSNYQEIDNNEIINRLDLIYSLKRKYGNNIEEILNYKKDVEIQIENIENLEEHNENLKKEFKALEFKMNNICNEMHKIRLEFSEILSSNINNELKDLEMKNASFKINVIKNNIYDKNGFDDVEFVISTNVGEEYKPLIKIASGGEISRIMLAIKVVLANIDTTSVMVFDEIDTGISGTAARAVSDKMKKISKTHQLICITHLAVVAAKADYNYLIKKEVIESKTVTCVKVLDDNETLREIARISSGEITEITLKHALELRNLNKIPA